jgi:tetratricopeptide (TPR) repeat protein
MLAWVLVFAAAAPSAEELRAQATSLYQRRQYAPACTLFRQAHQLRPDDAELLADLGLCQLKAGQPTAALASFRAALQAPKVDAETRRNVFYNLGLLEHDETPEWLRQSTADCRELPSSVAQCTQTLSVCLKPIANATTTGTVLQVGEQSVTWAAQRCVDRASCQARVCRVVWVDGCAHRVGLFCTQTTPGPKRAEHCSYGDELPRAAGASVRCVGVDW